MTGEKLCRNLLERQAQEMYENVDGADLQDLVLSLHFSYKYDYGDCNCQVIGRAPPHN